MTVATGHAAGVEPEVAGRLPWPFVQVLLDRLGTREERDWYAAQAAESGWSRNVLDHQIEVNLRSAYVAIVDDLYRDAAIHRPTIGVLLCTGKSGPAVRYALASASSLVAVANYYGLPDDAHAALPSAAELQAVITDEIARIES